MFISSTPDKQFQYLVAAAPSLLALQARVLSAAPNCKLIVSLKDLHSNVFSIHAHGNLSYLYVYFIPAPEKTLLFPVDFL